MTAKRKKLISYREEDIGDFEMASSFPHMTRDY